jgi:hypothetical protein
LSLSAFSRAWRALERPKPFPVTPPDEIGLRRATRKDVGVVGAKGFEPLTPTPRIVLPDWIAVVLADAA